MKKSMKAILICLSILIVTIIVVVIIFIKPNNKDKYVGEIKSFYYYYGGGEGPAYQYELQSEDGKVYFTAKGLNGVIMNVQCEVDESVMTQLKEIVDTHNIYNWDGFNRKKHFIMDGSSFKLEITYENDEDINAYGHMKYPKGYREAQKALVDFLDDLVEEYSE